MYMCSATQLFVAMSKINKGLVCYTYDKASLILRIRIFYSVQRRKAQSLHSPASPLCCKVLRSGVDRYSWAVRR